MLNSVKAVRYRANRTLKPRPHRQFVESNLLPILATCSMRQIERGDKLLTLAISCSFSNFCRRSNSRFVASAVRKIACYKLPVSATSCDQVETCINERSTNRLTRPHRKFCGNVLLGRATSCQKLNMFNFGDLLRGRIFVAKNEQLVAGSGRFVAENWRFVAGNSRFVAGNRRFVACYKLPATNCR